jgi:hypothetical protein
MDEPNRTRLAAGGNRVHYPGDAGTPITNLLTIKLLLNSIISTPNAKFMTMDIKDFLNTPMARFEYMQLRLSDMPKDVTVHYKLNKIATPEGYIYCKIQKGMYGLPQAGVIAQQLLEECLQMDGYHQSKTTPGLWTHGTHPISFSLVVDDFWVKYVGKENAQHLLDTVQKLTNAHATGKVNATADSPLSGTTRAGKSTSPCRGTSKKASPASNTPHWQSDRTQPYPHVKPNSGVKKQYLQEDDDSPALDKAGK